MIKPKIPECETERLQALIALNILDTKSEKSYDAITAIAKKFFDVPIVAISLVDAERQWFKSIQGLDVCETSREVSFCGHTILQDEVFLVENALEDERFCDNPLVSGEPKIRFYAGCPVKSASGYRVGTLCIIDTKPRKFSKKKLNVLKDFVTLIEEEFFEKRKSVGYLNEIAKIQEMYISNEEPRKLFNYILSFLLRHTGSEYGFIGAVLQDKEHNLPYLKTYAITNIAWNDETNKFYEENAPQGMEFRNLDTLFGYSLKTGQQVISNQPKTDPRAGGIPKGHPPLNSYLGMPIHGSDGFIAMYGLANRAGGYTQALADDLMAVTQIMSSIIESSANMATVNDMAERDQLTRAYNRYYLRKYVTNILESHKASKHAFMMIDFDNFKKINDYYGHPVGDVVLKLFIQRLDVLFKDRDCIARIGGDEFIIFLENISEYSDAGIIAQRILSLSKQPYKIEGVTVESTVSIGVVCYPEAAASYEELSKKVDLALYQAKQEKNQVVFYSQQLNENFKRKIELEEKIMTAFKQNEFYCVYQPQFDISTQAIVGVEALVRWRHDVLPPDFLPAIEAMNLGNQLNLVILEKVIKDFSQNININSPIKLAVNLSFHGKQFQNNIIQLSELLLGAGLPKHLSFEFEITEGNILFSNSDNNIILRDLSDELKHKGVSLAIDDFGTKQSSINRIIEGNFSTIKIDRTYIDKLDTEQSKEAAAVIKAILCLANELNMAVIAEGVETEQQMVALQKLGIHLVQGYLLSEPLSTKQFNDLLNRP